ncbi:MAG: SGNH/GDSL hydrolase family protein [Tyzzerella sp.]|nr:SGNH/GDSL hydrolase family protein [Tyzzerella sp.]
MKLTLEQIRNITVGALNVWEEDGAFRFAKCTAKQVEAWYKVDQILGERSEATTGVRLDFHTNSKYFKFISRTVSNYEIYIDNVLTYAYFKSDFEDDKCKTIELDEKEHRITLYLPGHDDPGTLELVEISDGATLIPHKFDCKMLFIGDSITQGWESTWDSLSYANHVSRFFNAESVIQGIGGSMYHMTTFDEAIEFEPDIVIVAYGTNDWGRYKTLEEGREHCCKYLDQLVARYSNKKLFGISPIWRADSQNKVSMGSFEACTTYVKEEIKNHGMTLIDGETLTPHLPAFYSDEYLHPDTKGFGIYALNLISKLQKYL